MSVPKEPPLYKGEPLEGERGPGLGCFWIQSILLVVFLVLTPLTVIWAWDPFVSGVMLVATLVLLFFAGQTSIFLLRLVAADRRTRRTPMNPDAKQTVGQMEDDAAAEPTAPPGPTPAKTPEEPTSKGDE
jgi:hypothetical protein